MYILGDSESCMFLFFFIDESYKDGTHQLSAIFYGCHYGNVLSSLAENFKS